MKTVARIFAVITMLGALIAIVSNSTTSATSAVQMCQVYIGSLSWVVIPYCLMKVFSGWGE